MSTCSTRPPGWSTTCSGPAPGIRVLATSREPLSIAGEQVLPVPPLGRTDAVQLFIDRATAAAGRFEPSPAVDDVCRRLDGLPLAIELAAVRTRALSPEQIRDRLSDRFALLTGGSRAALPRHRTLRTAIRWSFDLLTGDERTLLTRLSVFAGRFTLDDAEAVCGATVDSLTALVEKSLVVREDTGYRLHETMREYPRAELEEAEALQERCADYYLARCQEFGATGRTRLVPSLAWAGLEIDNIRAVLRACLDRKDHARATGIATSLIWFWVTRATTEGARWLDELPGGHPWTYFARGFLGVLRNDPDAATKALETGLRAATGDVRSQSLAMAAIAAAMRGEPPNGLLDEARRIASELDDPGTTLMTQQATALIGLIDGDPGTAARAAAEGVRVSRATGDLYSLGMMLMNQGYAALRMGDLATARTTLTEGLRIARDIDDRVAQAYLVGALGCCAEPAVAARLLGASERLRAEIGAGAHPSMAPTLAEAAARLGTSGRLDREAAIRLALGETPAGLSRRETDVARLVTEGLSNQQIATRLFLSERTVESHIRNILTKLGFTTRTQIAAWQAAQG
ncbi:LuxR C-terminal-related transcriptional regulator [Actinoplanes sp. NPDC051411]|uniref:LuxR C-terminal-related transcriptional regulator n=1 Tax=Actinoplanes sp. NPDC051411 TaxID=3155522 RepID=UPI003430D8D7